MLLVAVDVHVRWQNRTVRGRVRVTGLVGGRRSGRGEGGDEGVSAME